MYDRDASIPEDPTNKEATMTVCRIFLTAQHRDVVAARSAQQPLQASLEPRCLCHLRVEDMTLAVVKVRLRRAAAQLVSKENALDVRFKKCRLERVPVELWVEPRK